VQRLILARRLIPPLVAGALLACAQLASAGTVVGTSGPLRATLHAGTHHPNYKQKWPISYTASLNGRPATAHVFYEFLYKGSVVSKQYVTHNKVFKFHGHYTDKTFGPFTSKAIGFPLTVRVVISAGGHTVNLDYPVRVVR
jgi:hypothetical protein